MPEEFKVQRSFTQPIEGLRAGKGQNRVLGSGNPAPETTLLSTMHVCSITSGSLWPCGRQPTRLLCPQDFPGKNTRVGCHFLLQGILLTWEWNPHLLHRQVNSLALHHLGNLIYNITQFFPRVVSKGVYIWRLIYSWIFLLIYNHQVDKKMRKRKTLSETWMTSW